MRAQTPAEGILKRNDWGDSKVYTVACDCGSPDHEHNVWIEAELEEITVTTYTKVRSKFWDTSRWQTIWTLLTRGYVELESDITMSKQQALNYAETLKSAITDVEEFERKRKINAKVQNRIARGLSKWAKKQ